MRPNGANRRHLTAPSSATRSGLTAPPRSQESRSPISSTKRRTDPQNKRVLVFFTTTGEDSTPNKGPLTRGPGRQLWHLTTPAPPPLPSGDLQRAARSLRAALTALEVRLREGIWVAMARLPPTIASLHWLPTSSSCHPHISIFFAN